jgi:uncharacterized protein (TIGR02466 family)
MSVVYPLFSLPLYTSSISIDNARLYNCILSEKFLNTNKNKNSKRTEHQNILLQPNYSEIYAEILQSFEDYSLNYLKINSKFKCVCSWAVLGERGSITSNHLHPNSVFSGIYYVKSNKDNGDLLFSVPQTHNTFCNSVIELQPFEFNTLNSKTWKITPNTGDIFIFPSHMYHGVSENKSDEIRCCISFNFFIDGMFSSEPTSQLNV